MKKVRVLMMVIAAVVFAGGASAFTPAPQGAQAQAHEAPASQVELVTISLLQSILAELVKLNSNVEQLPAAEQ